MGRERRDDEKLDENAEMFDEEETTDRRSFLKQAGMIGGGALVAMAGLAASAGAQQDIRLGPEGRMRTIDPRQLSAVQLKVASQEQYAQAFARLREMGATQQADRRWAEAMAGMSPGDRVGGVAVLELRQRFRNVPNLGENLVVLFSLLAAGKEQLKDVGEQAAGLGCGSGCGGNCLAPVAGGLGCGSGCGGNCAGADAGGVFCGGGCQMAGLRQVTFDREGTALEGVQLRGLDLKSMAAAMQNADRAFSQVFG
ncbi:MAG: hypothetical protein ACOX9R_06820 [Armatimonadota bacterium]|jgi:hypothetical protein